MLGGFTEMMVLPGTQRDLLRYAPSPGLLHCPCGPHGPPGRAWEHQGWTVPAGEAAGEAAGSPWGDGLGQTPQGEGTPSEALLAFPVPTQHGWSRMCHSEPQQSHSRFWGCAGLTRRNPRLQPREKQARAGTVFTQAEGTEFNIQVPPQRLNHLVPGAVSRHPSPSPSAGVTHSLSHLTGTQCLSWCEPHQP